MAELSTIGFTGGQTPPAAPFVNPTPVTAGVTSPLVALGSIFTGAAKFVKDQADDEPHPAITELGKQVGSINEAVAQGNIKAPEAATRTRALYNSALAANPELSKEIGQLGRSFTAHTQ